MQRVKLNKKQTRELIRNGYLIVGRLIFVYDKETKETMIAELLRGAWTLEFDCEEDND